MQLADLQQRRKGRVRVILDVVPLSLAPKSENDLCIGSGCHARWRLMLQLEISSRPE